MQILFKEQVSSNSDAIQISSHSTKLEQYLDVNIYELVFRELEQIPASQFEITPNESHLLISFKSLQDITDLHFKLKRFTCHKEHTLHFQPVCKGNSIFYRVILNTEPMRNNKRNVLEITKFIFKNATRVNILKSFEETFLNFLEENAINEIFDLTKTFGLINPILSLLLKIISLHKNQELNQLPKLEIRDVKSETLLHFAASSSNNELLVQILPICSDVNTVNIRDETAMHKLAASDNFELESWKYLIDNDANVLFLDDHLLTPITNLSYQNNDAGLQAVLCTLNAFYISKDTRIDNVLFFVVSGLSFDVVKATCDWFKRFVRKPFDDVKILINGKNANILDAAFENYDGKVLEYVINTLECTSYLCVPPKTCIHDCLSEQKLSENQMVAYINHVAKYFPEFINARNEQGLVPLSNYYITLAIVEALLENGADINITDYEGNTPLHTAVRSNKSPEIISTLVKFGADVNAKNFSCETPLICATNIFDKRDLPGLIQHLLKLGADARKRYENGNTILHLLPHKVDQLLFQEIIECFMYFGYKNIFENLNDNRSTPFDTAQNYFQVAEKYKEMTNKVLQIVCNKLC